jgi:hypothetical protein
MASRLPVVATQAGGIPELVIHEQTGLLVPPKNPQSLAEAILRVYEDRKLARQMAENGYKMVHDKFSASGMAEKIIREYERLAEKKRIHFSLSSPRSGHYISIIISSLSFSNAGISVLQGFFGPEKHI